MHHSIDLAEPLGAQQAGTALREPVSIQFLVVSLLTGLRFGVSWGGPELDM